MMWTQLYKERNELEDLTAPLRWYKDWVESVDWVNSINIEKSIRLTADIALGFVVRIPTPKASDPTSDFKIITASDNDPREDRIVAMKELMHCCENEVAYQTDSKEKLEKLLNHFYGHSTQAANPAELYILSEPVAFWKATSLITTEKHRLYVKAQIEADGGLEAEWAAKLKIPEWMIDPLIGPGYEAEVAGLNGGSLYSK